jgi:hypothetical protein
LAVPIVMMMVGSLFSSSSSLSLSLFLPGIFFILPCIDAYARVDLRTRTYDVPPQELSIRTDILVAVCDDVCRNPCSVSFSLYIILFNFPLLIPNVGDATLSAMSSIVLNFSMDSMKWNL